LNTNKYGFLLSIISAGFPRDDIEIFGEIIMYQAIFNLLPNKAMTSQPDHKNISQRIVENLSEAETNKEYVIKNVITNDKNVTDFLFTLGCFEGESVTVISILSENYVIAIKDARYSIDADLAKAVILN